MYDRYMYIHISCVDPENFYQRRGGVSDGYLVIWGGVKRVSENFFLK